MDKSKFRLGGILFLIAALLMILAGILEKRPVFTISGCSFMAIGFSFLSISKKQISM